MDRRRFLIGSLGGALAANASAVASNVPIEPGASLRRAFPRLANEIYLNAAGLTPLATFVEAGIEHYLAFERLGPGVHDPPRHLSP